MGKNPVLEEGQAAPEFQATLGDGTSFALSSLQGKNAVLYFYPKDDTPGCTTQACDFRDNFARLETAGFTVLGISPDGEASHQRFVQKYDLPFSLVCDPDHSVAEAYGVWREKKNYGRTYMGIVRSTFVLDPRGNLTKIYDNVRAKGHVERLLRELGVEA